MEPETWKTLTDAEQEKLKNYVELLTTFTKKHNLISPATIPHIWEWHIEHSLVLAQRGFPAGCTVVDWGTGGGLPVIPLAITFPDVQFVAVDAVGKKVMAVRAMARQLGLSNLEAWNGRAEQWDGTANYSVSRATAPLEKLWMWHNRRFSPTTHNASVHWTPGLICLKGGDLNEEIATLKASNSSLLVTQTAISDSKRASFFREKYILHICVTLE